LAEAYRSNDAAAAVALTDKDCGVDAAQAIRALLEELGLVTQDNQMKIELVGELGALFALANEHPRSKETGVQVTLVAGARNHLCRTRLRWVRKFVRCGSNCL